MKKIELEDNLTDKILDLITETYDPSVDPIVWREIALYSLIRVFGGTFVAYSTPLLPEQRQILWNDFIKILNSGFEKHKGEPYFNR